MKLFILSVTLIFRTGCGTSPQEKRNNYDACLIDEEVSYKQRMKDRYPALDYGTLEDFADQNESQFVEVCVVNLK